MMDDEWIIFWWNSRYGCNEIEEFDSYEDAKDELIKFSEKYPWNVYRLARVEVVVPAMSSSTNPDKA